MVEWKVVKADCREFMRGMEAESVDAVCCDPPYDLTSGGKGGFMGQAWDGTGVAFDKKTWEEVFRVLRPGSHLLAFGGTRTYHRLVCAIEDAGFDVRDCINYCFGTGFPKSLNVSKAMDKAAGVTEEAKKWAGWGSALKPAHELICVARKPLIGTVAENILKFGTGGLNVDACRVVGVVPQVTQGVTGVPTSYNIGGAGGMPNLSHPSPLGRWPPNQLLTHSPNCRPVGFKTIRANSYFPDYKPAEEKAERKIYGGGRGLKVNIGGGVRPETEETEAWECEEFCPVRELDRQSGESKSPQSYVRGVASGNKNAYSSGIGDRAGDESHNFGDKGGASRFFPQFGWDAEEVSFMYQAKASRSEREAGLVGELKNAGSTGFAAEGFGAQEGHSHLPVKARNIHPTVKPRALMAWLCKLVTPPGGLILDPFNGSGSTGCAAVPLGFRYIGIDLNEEYCEIARKRIAYWEAKEGKPARTPLEAFDEQH